MEDEAKKEEKKVYPHNCGQCGLGFLIEEEYLDHPCEVTGTTPRPKPEPKKTEDVEEGEVTDP